MRLAVAFTVSALRQDYLRTTLDSWARVRGVGQARLLFAFEPLPRRARPFPVAEFREYLARSFPGCWYTISTAEERQGCFANTRRAVDQALATGRDFVVLAEEDVTVADDTLEYFRWAAQTYHGDQDVIAVCAHSFRSAESAAAASVVRAPWFSPIVWGTWPDRWRDFIRPGWGGAAGNPDAWDLNLRQRIAAAGRVSVFPLRSRALHHGKVSTLTPGALAEHFYGASVSRCFAAHYPPQDYGEILRSPAQEHVI